jgi:hypothetical protein
MPHTEFNERLANGRLHLAVSTSAATYLDARLSLLRQALDQTNSLAAQGQLPDAELSSAGLKISPVDSNVPKEADALREDVYGLLPHVKITDLLLEALALREIGRIERTLFTLAWIEDPSLRRRVTAGLNKGEARNSLAKAVFFNRLGEVRDRSFENQRYRASGLNLVVAAIALWNTVYLERAADALARSRAVDHALFPHVSPLGWEHVNLTGDYTWHTNKRVARGGFRPLRTAKRCLMLLDVRDIPFLEVSPPCHGRSR